MMSFITITMTIHLQVLLKEGAVMEERQGWERPGWFLSEGTVTIPSYDYYGSYGSSRNENNRYSELLHKDYTFGFPEHHQVVSVDYLWLLMVDNLEKK